MSRRRKHRKKSHITTIVFAIIAAAGAGLLGYAVIPHKDADATGTCNDIADESQSHRSAGPEACVVIPDALTEEVIYYPGFTVSFNADTHLPNWVAWELTGEEAEGNAARRKDATFMPDINVDGCPTLADYNGSGYDRGHMAPAADMKWSKEAMEACFMLTNMAPQDKALNSGAWNKLEEKCRLWAKRDSALWIVCGPVLSGPIDRTIGDSRVVVPERFFKVIVSPYTNPPRGVAFIMPNCYVPGGIQTVATSIDEVERVTGMDFFSSLPDEIENEIESQCNFPLWSRK